MPYTNEDKLYDEIALINEKLRTLTNEIAILRKQTLKTSLSKKPIGEKE